MLEVRVCLSVWTQLLLHEKGRVIWTLPFGCIVPSWVPGHCHYTSPVPAMMQWALHLLPSDMWTTVHFENKQLRSSVPSQTAGKFWLSAIYRPVVTAMIWQTGILWILQGIHHADYHAKIRWCGHWQGFISVFLDYCFEEYRSIYIQIRHI